MDASILTDMRPHELAAACFWESPCPLVAAAPAVPCPDVRALPPRCVCFATSGSTGNPSWVVLAKDALLASARAVNRHLLVTADSHWGLALPLHHVGGFGVAARAFAAGCGFSCFDRKWNAPLFCSWLQENRITHTSLVPTQVHDLVAARLMAPAGLVAAVVGGGRLAGALGRSARDLGWPVLASYGMTEAASQIATQRLSDRTQPYHPEPLPPLDIWQVETSTDGRIRIAGPALFSGWLRETGGMWVFEERVGDWFTANDAGVVSPSGLRILGRADGLVKILGELVSPERIESELAALSGIPLAVLAVPDVRAGNRLVPVVETGCAPAAVATMMETHHAACAGYERLSRPVYVDVIPRSPLGKVRRAELEELVRPLIDLPI